VYGLPQAARVRREGGRRLYELPPRSAGPRRTLAHELHDLSRAARRRTTRLHELSREARGSSRDGCGRDLYRVSPSALANPDAGGRVRELPRLAASRDGALSRLPRRTRSEAAGRHGDLRALSCRPGPHGHRHGPREVRRMSYRAWPEAHARGDHLRDVPHHAGIDDTRDGPRGLLDVPRERCPRSGDATSRVRELSCERGHDGAARPPRVRELPSAARADGISTSVRDVPRERRRESSRPGAGVRELPSPARTERPGGGADLQQLPSAREPAAAARGGAAWHLRVLPLVARSTAQRSGDLHHVPQGPQGPRAHRDDLRGLPSVPPVTRCRSAPRDDRSSTTTDSASRRPTKRRDARHRRTRPRSLRRDPARWPRRCRGADRA